MVTALDDTETAVSAMKNGAFDYVTKPIDLKQLDHNIKKALDKGRMARDIREYRESLEMKVEESTAALMKAVKEIEKAQGEVKEAHRDTIYRLSLAAEFRNRETASHLRRISEYSVVLARATGWTGEEVENIRLASIMHDIGKIGISDSILLKPGSLNKDEFENIKKHTIIGYEILYGSGSDFLKMAQDIVLTHHEKWDGTGYPLGLRGEQIPVAGRIVAVADVFDALTSPRVYKAAFTNKEAFRIIEEGSEKHFDPMVVRAFFSCKKAIEEAQRSNGMEGKLRFFFSPDEEREDIDKAHRYFEEWVNNFSN
jgi:putative two-component system response regulator